MSPHHLLVASSLLILALLTGCASESETEAVAPDALVVETKADSVALRAFEAAGGPQTWAALPYLRFDFGSERDGTHRVAARHLWNRQTGDYRVEMPAGGDTVYVALFNVETQEGQVYLDGAPLDSVENAERLQGAYRRFINDTYWLLVPTKLFDPGVHRTYVADSSDAETDVISLTFDEVGLTPGDQYWIYVDRATGRVTRWAYHLQHFEADRPPTSLEWTAYETLDSPAGPVTLATRKQGTGYVLVTDNLATPAEVAAEMFTDPTPRL